MTDIICLKNWKKIILITGIISLVNLNWCGNCSCSKSVWVWLIVWLNVSLCYAVRTLWLAAQTKEAGPTLCALSFGLLNNNLGCHKQSARARDFANLKQRGLIPTLLFHFVCSSPSKNNFSSLCFVPLLRVIPGRKVVIPYAHWRLVWACVYRSQPRRAPALFSLDKLSLLFLPSSAVTMVCLVVEIFLVNSSEVARFNVSEPIRSPYGTLQRILLARGVETFSAAWSGESALDCLIGWFFEQQMFAISTILLHCLPLFHTSYSCKLLLYDFSDEFNNLFPLKSDRHFAEALAARRRQQPLRIFVRESRKSVASLFARSLTIKNIFFL